jgi:hypothetical protein
MRKERHCRDPCLIKEHAAGHKDHKHAGKAAKDHKHAGKAAKAQHTGKATRHPGRQAHHTVYLSGTTDLSLARAVVVGPSNNLVVCTGRDTTTDNRARSGDRSKAFSNFLAGDIL